MQTDSVSGGCWVRGRGRVRVRGREKKRRIDKVTCKTYKCNLRKIPL